MGKTGESDLKNNEDNKSNRGGKRAGAGAKPEGETARDKVITIRATQEEKATYEGLGGPNWFRRMLRGSVKDAGEG